MTHSLIVLSGGMDSAVLLLDTRAAGNTVSAVSFNYGSKHNGRELPLAQQLCAKYQVPHTIIDLPFINQFFSSTLLQSGGTIPDGMYDEPSMKDTVVPFRNGIMLSIAAGLAESVHADEILLASHSGDHFIYPDCRVEFNTAMSEAIWLGTDKKVQVRFPYATIDKRAIGDKGRELQLDFTATWTCYKGGEQHCGTCGACQERKYALRYDEGKDPTSYLA